MAINFNIAPYFDDFEINKKFNKILFKPSLAVQARELNQLQSILQNQINGVSDVIFKPNSRVKGGELNYRHEVAYVNITSVTSIDDSFIGSRIANENGLEAVIVAVVPRTSNSSPSKVFVDYTNTDPINNLSLFQANDLITIDYMGSPFSATASATSTTGVGSIADISEGLFYSENVFVYVDKQVLVVSPNTPTLERISLGLEIIEEIITTDQDESLFDNALGTPNFAAVGADRYKVTGLLRTKESVVDENNYFELVRIFQGELESKVEDIQFNTILDLLAKRTYDESGDYIVDDFLLDVREHLDDGENRGIFLPPDGSEDKLVYILDPGRAYIRGYEVTTISNTLLETPKARETEIAEETLVPLQYQSNFIVSSASNSLPDTNANINLLEAAVVIGTAIVKSFYLISPGVYRLEVFDPVFNAGKSFTDVTNVTQPSTSFTATVDSFNYNGDQTSFVFPIPFGFVKEYLDGTVRATYRFNGTIGGNTVNFNSSEQFSANPFDYVAAVVTAGGVVLVKPDIVNITTPDNRNVELTFNSITPTDNSSVVVNAVLTKTNAVVRQKIVSSNIIETKPSASVITLDNADVFEIVSIKDETGSDITDLYKLDNGQRDTYYDFSSVSVISGTPPTGDITIEYRYFVHGGGDFFSTQSYDGIDYKDIQYFTKSSGSIFLGSALDFRNKRTASGVTTPSNSANNFVSNSSAISDFEYYLSRIDKIVLTPAGEFSVVSGESSLAPSAPDDKPNSITLYQIFVPAYTFERDDVSPKKYSYRRYTMSDIGNLNQRIENLEEVTALSLLESSVAEDTEVGSFKSGFLVDNFKSNAVSDFESVENRSVIDFSTLTCRPTFFERDINLEIESASGLVLGDGKLMLEYDEVPLITQNTATRTERIQPYIRFNFIGTMKLTPEIDTWVSTTQAPDNILDNGKIKTVTRFVDVARPPAPPPPPPPAPVRIPTTPVSFVFVEALQILVPAPATPSGLVPPGFTLIFPEPPAPPAPPQWTTIGIDPGGTFNNGLRITDTSFSNLNVRQLGIRPNNGNPIETSAGTFRVVNTLDSRGKSQQELQVLR